MTRLFNRGVVCSLVLGGAAMVASVGCVTGKASSTNRMGSDRDGSVTTRDGSMTARDSTVRRDGRVIPGVDSGPSRCGPAGEIAGLAVEEVTPGDDFDRPVFITQAPGVSDTLWVVENDGRIMLVRDGEILATPFLDIRDTIGGAGGETGLLGLAFHPDYQDNGRFFVMYTPSSGTDQNRDIVAEYHRDTADRADDEEVDRLVYMPRTAENHNGGTISFGPDRKLYVSAGDGGDQGDPDNSAQSLDSLHGKILRLDVDNEGENDWAASDNPDLGGLPQIWVYGLRNPWKHSFDRQTGDLYIGDVGGGEMEEVDVQPASSSGGENYGWRRYEGTQGSGDFEHEPPVLEYRHGSGAASDLIHNGNCIIGGYVYRGSAISSLQGFYLFGDHASSDIGAFRYCEGLAEAAQRLEGLPGDNDLASFGQDNAGELYLVYLSGRIVRIVPE